MSNPATAATESRWSVLADFAGFMLTVTSWMMLVTVPVILLILGIATHRPAFGIGAAAGFLVLGFLFRYLAGGVVHRSRGRTRLAGILALGFALLMLAGAVKLRGEAPIGPSVLNGVLALALGIALCLAPVRKKEDKE